MPLTDHQRSSERRGNTTLAHSEVIKKMGIGLAPEMQECAKRGKVWANLLIQENRRMRAKWVSETAEEIRTGQSQGATLPQSVEDVKKIYETIKAEDEAKLAAKREAIAFGDGLGSSPGFAVQSAIPSDPNVPFEERYSELLGNPNFVKIAKKTLKAWCISNAVPPNSQRTETQYLRMIRGGDDLAKRAWESVLPPVWDGAAMHWIWRDFSKTEKRKETSASQTGSKDRTDRGKTTPPPQTGSKEATDKAKDNFASHVDNDAKADTSKDILVPPADGNENGHKVPVLTKNQKRAKARKEKRKAEREAVGTAADPATSPRIPERTEEDAQQTIQATSAHVIETLAAETGPRPGPVTTTRDGKTYRVPAPARVDMSTAVKLARAGQLRVYMCPALGKGEADRLLKASHHFQSDIDYKNIGKDPHVITKFLMKTGVKPSEYEQILQLDRFLEVMKKIDELGLDDSDETKGDDNVSIATEASTASRRKEKVKGKAKAAADLPTNTDITSSWSSLVTSPSSAVPYPPPPQILKRHNVIPWSISLTPSQVNSLSVTDRWIALRGLLVAAHSFLTSAARLLPGGIFERLVNPASDVLKATDLPVAKYELARTIIYTKVMRIMYDRYAKEKAESPPGTAIKDYVVEAVQDLNTRYATVEQMVGGARAKVGRELEEKLASGREEAEIRPGDGSAELVELAERAVEGEEMWQLAEKKAEGMVEFLVEWPMLEGVVTGEGSYVPPA